MAATTSTRRGGDETEPLLRPAENQGRVTYQNVNVRIAAAMFSFIVLGLFVSSIGVMLPYIEKYYELNDVQVSLIFLVGPIGYVLAAQSNDFIHLKLGQRGIAILGPVLQLLSAALISLHPPFPRLLGAFALLYLGAGFLDGSFCAWAGSMGNSISGMLHGSFSIGAAAGPFLAQALISSGSRPWYNWYYIVAGASVLETLVLAIAFRLETAAKYREEKQDEPVERSARDAKAMFKHRATWLAAAYLLAYVGNETAISGWIVSFMRRARHTTPYVSSLASSGFSAGQAVGRLVLGFVTDKFGLGRATSCYFLCAIIFTVVFAIVQIPVVSLILMTLSGFFMGPLFPSAIVLLTLSLPRELHVAAVSFVASVGQVGGALLPFVIGALIQGLGIEVFQYVLIAMLVIALLLWMAFARFAIAAPSRHAQDEQA